MFDYAYDEGNRTLRTEISTGATTEYQWDHRNRLVAIIERDGAAQVTQTVEYAYDLFDRRIQKSVAPAVGPAEVEQLVPDGVHTLLRLKNGSLASRNLYGPAVDQILADEQLDPSTGQTDRLLWPLADNLGTIRDVAEFHAVTGTTSVVNHLVFDAFGRITSESNPSVDHAFGYTGRDRDPESDLYYYRARYYDPATGRFVSEDPIGFAAGDGNLVRYVGNGVTNAVDPSGLREGHHWVPQSVFNALAALLTEEAKAVFENATRDPGIYDHGFDTWSAYGRNVTHGEYNGAVKQLLQNFKAKFSPNRQLPESQARKFVDMLVSGACTDRAFYNANKELFETIFTWRAGFLQSVLAAQAAKDLNPRLTKDELKAIAQMRVNGSISPALARHYTKRAAETDRALGKLGLKVFRPAAAKVVPLLGTILAASSMARASHAGSRNGVTGVAGAIDQGIDDLMCAELAESYLLYPAAQGFADFVEESVLGVDLDGMSKKERQILEALKRAK